MLIFWTDDICIYDYTIFIHIFIYSYIEYNIYIHVYYHTVYIRRHDRDTVIRSGFKFLLVSAEKDSPKVWNLSICFVPSLVKIVDYVDYNLTAVRYPGLP